LDLNNRQLSDRERTVLLLAADGLTDKEIAQRLSLSQRTIGTYWERMREKLGHYSRTQLVARFLTGSAKADDSANYKSLFSTWEEGIWIVLDDGTTIYSNHRIPELFDMTPESFEITNAKTLIEKATSLSFEELLKTAKKEDQKIEFSVKREDHSTIWMSMSATAVSSGQNRSGAVILRLTDVTVQRKVKSTLDTCEQSLLFLSDRSTDFIARFDSNLCCCYANPALKSLFEKEMVGKKVLELPEIFNPNEDWVACLVEALGSGKPQSFSAQMSGASEESKTHLLPVPTDDGKTVEVISISTRPLVH
jgi:PAS domain S-box-containing protein